MMKKKMMRMKKKIVMTVKRVFELHENRGLPAEFEAAFIWMQLWEIK